MISDRCYLLLFDCQHLAGINQISANLADVAESFAQLLIIVHPKSLRTHSDSEFLKCQLCYLFSMVLGEVLAIGLTQLGSGNCDDFFLAGLSKIKIRTSSRHTAR